MKKTLWTMALCLIVAGAAAQTPETLQRLKAFYTYVGPFEEGMAVVCKNGNSSMDRQSATGRFWYVDTLGKVCFEEVYDYAFSFQGGAAIVGKGKVYERKFGLINQAGKLLTECIWEEINPMWDGIAVARNGTTEYTYSLIDSLGHETKLDYDFCSNFSEGLAVVGRGTRSFPAELVRGEPGIFVGKHGFIDKAGNLVIALDFDEAKPFWNGLAPVGKQGKYYIKWGFIDKKGTLVIPINYYEVSAFSNNRAKVGKIVNGKPAYGYIDPFGNEVIPCQYTYAGHFQFANAWVGVEDENKRTAYMLINAGGKEMMTYKVYDLNDSGKYGHASAAVWDDGRLYYGLLDIKGRVVLPFEYDEVVIYSGYDDQTGKQIECGQATKDGEVFTFDLHAGQQK